MSNTPRFPEAHVELVGQDGNAFGMIGRTQQALRRAGATQEEITKFADQATSGDYANVIRTIHEWVEVD